MDIAKMTIIEHADKTDAEVLRQHAKDEMGTIANLYFRSLYNHAKGSLKKAEVLDRFATSLATACQRLDLILAGDYVGYSTDPKLLTSLASEILPPDDVLLVTGGEAV
jgi:hypothetical protein